MHFSQLDKKIESETWFSVGPEWCDLVRGPDLSVRSGQTCLCGDSDVGDIVMLVA